MSTLTELSIKYGTDKNIYGHNYMPVYEEWIGKRNIKKLLEVGWGPGASPKMWREYFPVAEIYIIELFGEVYEKVWDSPNTYHPGIEVISGDARLPEAWEKIEDNSLDVVIDDATHIPSDQIAIFNQGFRKVKPRGLYFIEDMYCSFDPSYNKEGDAFYPWLFDVIENHAYPGPREPWDVSNYIEYKSKVPAYYNLPRDFYINREFMKYPASDIYSFHLYRNIIVLEKA